MTKNMDPPHFHYLVDFQCVSNDYALLMTILEMILSLIALGLLVFLSFAGIKRLKDIRKVDRYDINNDQ